MKIALINPPQYVTIKDGKEDRYYALREECCWGVGKINISLPGQMTQIGGVLKEAGHQVKQIDANVLGISTEEIELGDAEVVIAMACVELTLEQDLTVLKKAKDEGKVTVAVVNDPYYTTEIMEEFPFIDYFVREERHATIKNLMEHLSKGHTNGLPVDVNQIKGLLYRSGSEIHATGVQEQMNLWAASNYDNLPLEKYNRAIIVTGYGCPYACTFCHFQRGKRQTRPVHLIVEDVQRLKKYHYNDFYMMDLELTIDKKYLLELCAALKPLGIKWLCDGRVNEVDKELLKAMAEAGCVSITYGIESGSNEILRKIKKGITAEMALEKIKMTAEAGITAYSCFIIGFPWETKETLAETEKLMKAVIPKYTLGYSLNYLRPIPRTELHTMLVNEGQIKPGRSRATMPRGSAIHYWELVPTYVPPALTKEELIAFRKRVLQELFKSRVWKWESVRKFIRYPLKDKISIVRKLVAPKVAAA